jgi:hypothetical protein
MGQRSVVPTVALVGLFVFTAILFGCNQPTGGGGNSGGGNGSSSGQDYEIGDTGPAGGVIFYDDEADDTDDIAGARYLEAWTADETGTYQWKTGGNTSMRGTSTAVGSGYENTYTAMAGSDHPPAEVVRNATHGGHNDWFLPSRDELDLMYQNKGAIGGFASAKSYWSSSEEIANLAWRQYFDDDGNQFDDGKNNDYRVRAARAF